MTNYRPKSSYSNNGRTHGKAGGVIGSQKSKFGWSARVGADGERYFARLLKENTNTNYYHTWYGLKIPSDPLNRNMTVYRGDVDIAVAYRDRLDLIDVKRWAGGYHCWSISGRPMKGLRPLKHEGKKWEPLSRNMELARDRYQGWLPGIKVRALTVFVPTQSGGIPSSVFFLRWPGGIRSYKPQDAIRKIHKDLGKPVGNTGESEIDNKIPELLGRMLKNNGS